MRSLPRARIAIVAAAVLLVGGVSLAVIGTAGSAAPRSGASSEDRSEDRDAAIAAGAADGLQDPVASSRASARTEATATRVQIPAIGVDSGLEQLPLDPATGELTPPAEWMSAGWYRDGTVPGDVGPAVIAGHVDSTTGPAVFFRLGELKAGDQILVTLSTGEVREFVVDSQRSAPKSEFPTEEVYGPTPTEELRLITCDGEFDGSTGHYVDNLIIDAHLI